MALTGMDKFQQFQDNRDAIVGAFSAPTVSEPQEALQNVFAVAHDAGTTRKQTDLVQQVREGTLDVSQLSIRVGGAEAVKLANQIQKVKDEQTRRTRMLLAMLDDLDRMAVELQALKDQADRSWASFSERHGGIEGILETYFTEEEREGLETPEDIQRALVDKFLNPDGSLKPGAADILSPEDIEELRDWQRLQQKELEFVELVDEVQANGGEITEDHRRIIETSIGDASLDEVYRMAQSAEGTSVEEATIEADNASKVELAQDISSGGFTL